jgi:hypothetical protein
MKNLFKAPDLQAQAWSCFGTAAGMLLVFWTLTFSYLAVGFNVLLGLYYLWLDAKKLVIKDDEGPYLTRYHLIRTPWFRVFLHRIHRPDKDRDPHNHPWPRAFAFVLRGGYLERITELDGLVRRTTTNSVGDYDEQAKPWSTEAFRPGRYHRIVDVLPGTWTLFFAGARSRDWGFLVDTDHVPCREYLGLPDDHDFGD